MQVVILAAGRGSRLGPTANGLPKCLLDVNGRPLIEHFHETLTAAGAGPFLAVLGYQAEAIRSALPDGIETRINPRYDVTNSLYSLWLARDWIDDDVVIANSDILIDPEIVERLFDAGPDHLAYDSTSGKAAEHMKVSLENERIVRISKETPGKESDGENVGLIHLENSTARRVLQRAERMIRRGEENAFWVEALQSVCSSPDRPVGGVDIAGIPWIEIDFPEDLRQARQAVSPVIRSRALSPTG